MNDFWNRVGVVLLAAGKGARLGCTDIPKILMPLNGQPIISYILEELTSHGVKKENIALVVGYESDKVINQFGAGYKYPLQKELLGTAHAANKGVEVFGDEIEHVLVLNGDDTAFYKFKTLDDFMAKHLANDCDVSMLTIELEDPSPYGRVVRDEQGGIVKIEEKEEVTEEHKSIKEVNINNFCFKKDWFLSHYPNLKPISGLGEYGLPSFVEEATSSQAKFKAWPMDDPSEWHGINTPEELARAEKRKQDLK